MIDWLRSLIFRADPEEEAPTPDITDFLSRQRASRADAIGQRRASERVTRELRLHPIEGDLLAREGRRHDARRD